MWIFIILRQSFYIMGAITPSLIMAVGYCRMHSCIANAVKLNLFYHCSLVIVSTSCQTSLHNNYLNNTLPGFAEEGTRADSICTGAGGRSQPGD